MVELYAVSKSSAPYIGYAWNSGFEYYHLEQNNTPSLGMLSLHVNNTPSTIAGSRYNLLLELKSTISINEQVTVTIDFVDYGATANVTIDTVASGANRGFMFVGSCYARCDYSDTYHTCIHQDKC